MDSEVSALKRITANGQIETGSSARMARIDDLVTQNYNRILMRDLGNSEYVYRSVNSEMIDIYEAQGRITGRGGSATYFSLDLGLTPAEHMFGAQMPSPPQVMLKIPVNEMTGPIVPRPNWGTATVGREYFTNSYPNWGREAIGSLLVQQIVSLEIGLFLDGGSNG